MIKEDLLWKVLSEREILYFEISEINKEYLGDRKQLIVLARRVALRLKNLRITDEVIEIRNLSQAEFFTERIRRILKKRA